MILNRAGVNVKTPKQSDEREQSVLDPSLSETFSSERYQ